MSLKDGLVKWALYIMDGSSAFAGRCARWRAASTPGSVGTGDAVVESLERERRSATKLGLAA